MTDHVHPATMLKKLIQFDTTNPPGNEAACITYIQSLLEDAGIDSQLYEKVPGRPNIIARLTGQGNAAPLLLQGHVDVVTTAGQDWQHPPFAGLEVDGYIWGRGALDMKGGVAMMLHAFLRAAENPDALPGDVILCIMSDEEADSDAGARFLVEEHPELFEGVCYAIGEFGGFNMNLSGKRFYPIMIAEKQACRMQITLRGAAGHGSMPIRGGTMARLGSILQTLDRNQLPVHITPSVQLMFESVAKALGGVPGMLIRQLLNPALTNTILRLMGEQGRMFSVLLHNTASPTILHASDKINVIPAEVQLELDGRLLPGLTPDVMMRELHHLLGNDIEITLHRHDPYPSEPDMGLYDLLKDTLSAADPSGIPIPLVLPGVTDGRFFAALGIQTYGFLPMQLPQDFNFSQTIHAANERIPVEAVSFGSNAIYEVLQQFH